MKILVIEPHPDDAFLCLDDHFINVWAEHDVTILTVYANERRTREAWSYAEAVGATHGCLCLPECNMNGEGSINPTKAFEMWYESVHGHKLWGAKDYDRVIGPLGLQHPDHHSVRDLLLHIGTMVDSRTFHYVDTPYQIKQKNQEELAAAIEGKSIESMRYPGKRKWKRKEIFKSQSRFFYYNDFESMRLAEIVVEVVVPRFKEVPRRTKRVKKNRQSKTSHRRNRTVRNKVHRQRTKKSKS